MPGPGLQSASTERNQGVLGEFRTKGVASGRRSGLEASERYSTPPRVARRSRAVRAGRIAIQTGVNG